MISGFIAGLTYPFRALGVLARTPRLWSYVLVPVLVNLLVGVTIYVGLLFAGFRTIDAIVVGLPTWAVGVGTLLRALLVVVLLLATGFVLVQFGVVLGAPWYTKLSNELEWHQTGQVLPETANGSGGALHDLWLALKYELQKLALVLLVGIGLLLLNLVPVVGQLLSFAGWIALGATVACLDFLGYALERRRLGFGERLGVVRRSMPASAGFGLICLGLVSIPFVNLLSIPLCVTAGTLFFCERARFAVDRQKR